MSLQLGIDMVSVRSISEALELHGERYLDRIYTPQEIADCRDGDTVAPERLAARFAAKEAAMKALRLPPSEGLDWRSLELVREPDGWTRLRLTGRAAELAGTDELSVSVSHEDSFAVAVVILDSR